VRDLKRDADTWIARSLLILADTQHLVQLRAINSYNDDPDLQVEVDLLISEEHERRQRLRSRVLQERDQVQSTSRRTSQ
jgi:hypothetical protein